MTFADDPIKKIARGSVATAAGILSGKGLEYLNRVLVARFLSPELFGLYGLSLAVLNLAAVLGSIGFNTSVPRFVANYTAKGEYRKAKGTLFFSLMILIPAGLATAVLLYAGSDFIALDLYGKEKLSTMIRFIAPIVPLEICLAVATGYMQGRQELFLSSLYGNTVPRLLFLISLAALYLFLDVTVQWVIVGLGTGYLISVLLSLTQIFKSRLPSVQPDWNQTAILSYSWPIALTAIFSQLASRCDLYVMGFYLTGDQMGYFGACHILASVILLPQAFVNRAVLPVMSSLAARDNDAAIRSAYFSIIHWYAIFSVPVVVGFIVYSRPLITLFFGTNYEFESLPLVCGILAIGNMIGLLAGPNGMLMASLGLARRQMAIGICSGILGLAAAFVLISHWGIAGAAMANAFYIGISNLSGLYFLRKWIPFYPIHLAFVKTMVSGTVALAVVIVARSMAPEGILSGDLLSSLLFAGMYLALLLRMRILRAKDFLSFKRMWAA